jgi:hypothetical protein
MVRLIWWTTLLWAISGVLVGITMVVSTSALTLFEYLFASSSGVSGSSFGLSSLLGAFGYFFWRDHLDSAGCFGIDSWVVRPDLRAHFPLS